MTILALGALVGLAAAVPIAASDDGVPRILTSRDAEDRPAAGGVSLAGDPAEDDLSAEPIAYIGHGAFFDRDGRQIVPTADFVERAQSWYFGRLVERLSPDQQDELTTFEWGINRGLRQEDQERLIVKQRSIDWMLSQLPADSVEHRMLGKLNALKRQLDFRLPERDDLELLRTMEPFEVQPEVAQRLAQPEFTPIRLTQRLETTNSGQDYIDECASHQVPIPPSIGILDNTNGTAGWMQVGFIPQAEQFIVGSPAEVRVFSSPQGMCIALPRYSNFNPNLVNLDGVICLSSITSKVCFWDNQMNGAGFSFTEGTVVPIGVPTTPGGLYQAGGFELVGGTGGVCTDCHAGENPYVIHPDSDLGTVLFGGLGGAPLNLPMFGPDRYDPIVGAAWYQNDLSHAQNLVPAACSGCHQQGGVAGRFPHLSSDIPGYCNDVLEQAIEETMPPGNPGGLDGTAEMNAFLAWCNTAPSAGPSNRGDPHITTTNGVKYDFQAAGEFVALRNSATGFELQTRQSPVLTTFTPGPNPHTGLSSCVSLNTAVALRLGESRLTYQPTGRDGRMQLNVNGKPAGIKGKLALDLGGGNYVTNAAAGGGIEVQAADGTRVIVTPNYWSSQGYWYLNIEVLDTPAREGIMGPILGGDWLPKAPNGSSFGPAPGSIPGRDFLLNQVFASAWQVNDATSLFDYGEGTSPGTFNNVNWPPPSGSSCTTIEGNPGPGVPLKPAIGMDPRRAAGYCGIVQDPEAYADCVYDMTVMGDPSIADFYALTLSLRN